MLEMADPKPSVLGFLLVGLMAVTFIILGKFLFTKFHVPGLSELFLSV